MITWRHGGVDYSETLEDARKFQPSLYDRLLAAEFMLDDPDEQEVEIEFGGTDHWVTITQLDALRFAYAEAVASEGRHDPASARYLIPRPSAGAGPAEG